MWHSSVFSFQTPKKKDLERWHGFYNSLTPFNFLSYTLVQHVCILCQSDSLAAFHVHVWLPQPVFFYHPGFNSIRSPCLNQERVGRRCRPASAPLAMTDSRRAARRGKGKGETEGRTRGRIKTKVRQAGWKKTGVSTRMLQVSLL